MKEKFIFAFFMFSLAGIAQEGGIGTVKVKKVEVDTSIYSATDELAEFPGGYQALTSFINKNIVYPDSAINNGISGTCYISFVVNVDGTISNIRVLRGISQCPECDQEAMRVIKLLPEFKPGRKGGLPVRVSYNIPINFRLK